MKIIEADDGIIKYETSEKAILSSFLEVKGSEKKYIAQIIRNVYNGAGYTVFARLLFNYDGTLLTYDRTLPEKGSEVAPFPFEIISKSFETADMSTLGRLGTNGDFIRLDSISLREKTLISVDKPQILNTLLVNFIKQNKKVFIIDTDGSIEAEKFYAGKDFKLPLNMASLEFIYNECLSDATNESKNLIKDIFKNLSEYSATVPFLPFETLKTIIDDMVEKSHEFRLMVLKNKLDKFYKSGYFASNSSESEKLSEILKSEHAVIDISGMEFGFKNKYAEVICSELENLKETPQVFIKLSDSITKKTISKFYNSPLPSIFMVNSALRYLEGMSPLFKNFIIEATPNNKEVFKPYRPFLNSMDNKNCLFIGEASNNIPLVFEANILSTEDINKIPQPQEEIPAEDSDDVSTDTETLRDELFNANSYDNEPNLSENAVNEEELTDEEENSSEINTITGNSIEGGLFEDDDFHTRVDESEVEEPENTPSEQFDEEVADIYDEDNTLVEMSSDDVDSDIMENIENLASADIEPIEPEIVEEYEDTQAQTESDDSMYEVDTKAQAAFEESRNVDVSELKVMPLNENTEDFVEEITELESDNTSDDDIFVELDEEIPFVEEDSQEINLDKEITEDVDRVYTTVKDDSISDMDLDLIDELNEIDSDDIVTDEDILGGLENDSFEELSVTEEEEDDFIEPLAEISDNLSGEASSDILETKKSSTPIVPVYEAEIPPEDRVISDPIEQGDTVIHAKYGTGVVEKMIKYGNKNLYSINFDNVGRRLLDPALTEIKKN